MNKGMKEFRDSVIGTDSETETHSELTIVWGDVTVIVGGCQTPQATEDQLFRVLKRLQKTMNGGAKTHDVGVN